MLGGCSQGSLEKIINLLRKHLGGVLSYQHSNSVLEEEALGVFQKKKRRGIRWRERRSGLRRS